MCKRPVEPGTERGGCVYAGVSGVGSGHELCQSESHSGVRRGYCRAGIAGLDPLRQRAGVHEPAFSGVVRGAGDRVDSHSAGETDAKRVCREFQWAAAGRVFERELVSEPVRRAAEDRGVAEGV